MQDKVHVATPICSTPQREKGTDLFCVASTDFTSTEKARERGRDFLLSKAAISTPHSEDLKLGGEENDRLKNYQNLLRYHLEQNSMDVILKSVNKGLVLGGESF